MVVYFLVLLGTSTPYQQPLLLALLATIVSFNLSAETFDLYRSWRTHSLLTLCKITVGVWMLTSGVMLFATHFLPSILVIDENLLIVFLCVTLPVLLIWRLIFREILFIQRRRGRNTRYAAIIGATQSGENLCKQLLDNGQLGIRVFGIFDDRKPERLSNSMRNKVTGNIDDVLAAAKNGDVDYIYIAMPMSAEDRITDILRQCSDTTCSVYILPNFFIYNLLNSRWQMLGSIQTLSVFDTPFQGANNAIKRLEDLLFGSLILIVASLPMLIIALGIKLNSRGPVIFKQRRYGLDGKQIRIYKFRTMHTLDDGENIDQAQRDDMRVTSFGAFLRRYSLDELPQFFNVLQGRMSIVGPRPHAVAHNEEYRKIIDGYMLRHKVKPGITGWAQIHGLRGETKTVDKMAKRVEYDLEYIHRWSVWLDLKIIFSSIVKGFSDKNAY